MNRDWTNKVKVVPMFSKANALTTLPTFATTATSQNVACDLKGFEEVNFIVVVDAPNQGTTTTISTLITITMQENDSNLTTGWTDVPQDESTNAVRFFETPIVATTAGVASFSVGAGDGLKAYYGTVKTAGRKNWMRAAVAITPAAASAAGIQVLAVLTEPRNDAFGTTSQFRSTEKNNGVGI